MERWTGFSGGQPDIEERMMLEGAFRNSRKDIAMNDIVLAREGKGPDRQFQYLCKWGAAQHLSGGRGHLINSDRKHRIQSFSRRSCCGADGSDDRDHSYLFPCA